MEKDLNIQIYTTDKTSLDTWHLYAKLGSGDDPQDLVRRTYYEEDGRDNAIDAWVDDLAVRLKAKLKEKNV
jgi:hypothetical protein